MTDLGPDAEQLRIKGAALDAAGNAIFITDREGHIIWANPAFMAISGFAMPEILGRKPNLVKSGAHDREFYLKLWSTILAGRTWHGQINNRRKDGSLYIAEQIIAPVIDASGIITHFVTVQRDTPERDRVVEALRQSEERFRQLAESIQAVHWIIDLERHAILYISPNYETIWGRTCASLVASPQSWLEGIVPEDRLRIVAAQARLRLGQYDEEYRIVRPDGSIRWIHDRAFPVRNAGGEVYRIAGVAEDITARKLAEAQVREQAALLDKANDAIIVRDLEYRIRFWNKGAERIYGWTAAEAIGHRSNELLYHDDTEFQRCAALVLAEGVWSGELRQRRKDGREIVVDVSLTLVLDESGNPVSVLAINTDITVRKHQEAQFLRAQRMESVGTLAGGIAHDLNNVLAPILMSIELLRIKFADPDADKLLDAMESSAQRGAQMIRQVLAFSRGRVEGERIPIQPERIVGEVGLIIQDTFSKSIRLEHCVVGEPWPVVADPTQLHQILLNLCVNARDAMPGGGRLSIRIENRMLNLSAAMFNAEARPGPYVIISVSDTGTGIPHGIREKIFEPFFTTKSIGKGTGLGLSTVLALVRGHGGFIELQSEPGVGSTFQIFLPASSARLPGTADVESRPELPRGRNELVLVVDDEEAIRCVARQILECFGYRVQLAANGAEAVDFYREHGGEVAVVLTDMAMPVLDGPATLLALRELNPAVKVIGSSGMEADSQAVAAKGNGFGFFVPKPYTAEVLLQALASVLQD